MAQSVKCLLCKSEDLSSNPGTHVKKKLGMVAHTCNSSAWEVEMGALLASQLS